jgi:hypothetical protein
MGAYLESTRVENVCSICEADMEVLQTPLSPAVPPAAAVRCSRSIYTDSISSFKPESAPPGVLHFEGAICAVASMYLNATDLQ